MDVIILISVIVLILYVIQSHLGYKNGHKAGYKKGQDDMVINPIYIDSLKRAIQNKQKYTSYVIAQWIGSTARYDIRVNTDRAKELHKLMDNKLNGRDKKETN